MYVINNLWNVLIEKGGIIMIKEYFEVYYDGDFCMERVKVYYIDPIKDRFLVVTNEGDFMWVYTKDCILKKDDND